MLSELSFASLLAYDPHDHSTSGKKHSTEVVNIKQDKKERLRLFALRLRESAEAESLRNFLGNNAIFVPVPRSAPMSTEGALWPSLRICEEIIAVRFCFTIASCLKRITPVPKSAFSQPVDRPTAQEHFASFAVVPSAITNERIIIVDDVVTRGATLFAAASRIQEAFPECSIVSFAMVRAGVTIMPPENMLKPVIGKIELRGEQTYRTP